MAMCEYFRMASITGLSAASVTSSQRPRSPGVIRPSGSTEVASRQSMPAPESARCPRWIMCHALASPRSAEYWHIGETTMRFGTVTLRSVNGENSALMGGCPKEGGGVLEYHEGGFARAGGWVTPGRGRVLPGAVGGRCRVVAAYVSAGSMLAVFFST